MPSTFSPNLRLELIAPGEQSNTWGITTNTNLGTLIEQSISGLVEVDVTADDVTLTALDGESDQSRNMMLKFTGTPDANRTVTAPAVSKLYTVINASSKPVTIISAAESSVGVTVGPDGSTMVYCDGTDVKKVIASGAKAPVGEKSFTLSGTTSVSNLSVRTAYGNAFTYTPASSDSTILLTMCLPYVIMVSPPSLSLADSYAANFELYETTTSSTFIGNIGHLGLQVWTTTYSNYGYGTMTASMLVSNADTIERTFQLYINPRNSLGKLYVAASPSTATITLSEVPN